MGWLNAVSVVQSVVRSLVFQEAQVPESSEVANLKSMPETDDYTVIYLDSYDELRRLSHQCAAALEGEASERHQRFRRVCEEKGLALNDAKRLVGATQGTLQGGELDGKKGWYKLAGDKQVSLVSLCLALAVKDQWSEFELRHLIGKATFGMCFRRPLLSIFQEVFNELRRILKKGPSEPAAGSVDEVLMVMAMTAFMGSSLKVTLDPQVSCSDASLDGGGAAVAEEFMREPLTVEHEGGECWWCGGSFRQEQRYPCPAACGVALCSLECMWSHRNKEQHEHKSCVRKHWRVPRFGERFSGPHAPLTHAVAQMGHIEVQRPFDLARGDDFFTDQGRETLRKDMEDEDLYAEHWAPECRLFSRARGRPIRLRSGRTISGPQPVRDAHHLMGFPWLTREMKARLRKSNTMALKGLRRGVQVAQTRVPRHWSLEHPKNSWLWEFSLAREAESVGFERAIGSHCCFGGRRVKWYAFAASAEEIRSRLNRDCPGHEGLLGYEVEELPDGRLHYATEEEAEYPWSLCLAYARGLRAQADKEKVFEKVRLQARELWYQQQLEASTARLAGSGIARPMATYLARWEAKMQRGEEGLHLRELLRAASMRGTDVRFHMQIGGEEPQHEIPYPALRWRWRTFASYAWKQGAHINELEMNAVIVVTKHRTRSTSKFHTRWVHIIDSMVCRGALAKGRSSSPRINMPLRKQAALSIAQNSYMFPLWTISGWNFSDKASRKHDKK